MRLRHALTVFKVFSCLLTIISSSASGAENVSFFGGKITGTAMAQDMLYLAQSHGITILDVRNPAKIRAIGHHRTEDYKIDALAIKWPVLFFVGHDVGHFSRHLGALNVTSPTQPIEIETADPSSGKLYFQLAIRGSRLIFDSNRHYIYDISDPFHPKEMMEEERAYRDKRLWARFRDSKRSRNKFWSPAIGSMLPNRMMVFASSKFINDGLWYAGIDREWI